ncbi:unnamed protein product [marine sediment metagenome]|uniref:DUF4878 domain-containing protein n=1 Tax=marine sediment metagenome TaxID=412755 RepID=X0U4P7_9ZZZZ
MAAHPTIKWGAPKINIIGDKADVKATLYVSGRPFSHTIYLVRENNKWLIMSYEY